MRMAYEMSLRQVQKLIMTPELRQAIAVLQLPTVDLIRYVEEEVTKNPVLEEIEPSEAAMRLSEPRTAPENGAENFEWERYFHDGTDLGYGSAANDIDSDVRPIDLARWEPSLYDYLSVQLQLSSGDERIRRIGRYIAGSLDANGFFSGDVGETAELLGCDVADVEKALALLQSLEPTGIGARDLKECLLIQLAAVAESTARTIAARIIAEHLDDVAEGRLGRISQALRVSLRDVQEAIDLVRQLDPKPGRSCGAGSETRYVLPDVIVERVDGEYLVIVNDSAVPRLGLSSYYRRLLSHGDTDDTVKDFLRAKLNSALWLIRSIEQRRSTIQKVMEAIVIHQRGFLDSGIKHLRPLTLRQVASEIGVHESTVSRATAGKYAQTPRGLLELRFFFDSGVSNSAGSSTSAASVKNHIVEMIAAEDRAKPLSDQEITDRLNSAGISISRRTVAKYREELMIAPSSRRKRY